MLVTENDRGFRLDYMDEDDLRSLRTLIENGGLTESRKWYNIKKEIDTMFRDK